MYSEAALLYFAAVTNAVAASAVLAFRDVTVIPMTYARQGDQLILHGAVASRWLSSFDGGREICVTVTLLDGLVLARSAFSHSMNYRSVVAFGIASLVTDPEQKQAAFKALLDHMLPGRWDDCKRPDAKEINATTVLTMPISEASIKVRRGPPADAEKDLGLDYWTGVIPLKLTAGLPEPDPQMRAGRERPTYVNDYRRPTSDS